MIEKPSVLDHTITTDQKDLDRVADAIARHRGAGPLAHMDESSAGQYRSMARAALSVASDVLWDRMQGFPQQGRQTRASWAVATLESLAKKS